MLETIAVEISTISEDYEQVRRNLAELARIGVRYLNLHQMYLTKHNYRNVGGRGYTLTPCLDHNPVVLESELDSLRLLRHAAAERDSLSAHYCSTIYKQRYQNRGQRMRAALAARIGPEAVSESGYLFRLSATDTPENIARAVKIFNESDQPESFWSFSDNRRELVFHPDLLGRIDPHCAIFQSRVCPGRRRRQPR